MNKPSIIAMQYGCIVVAIACAVALLWGHFAGWLNAGWIIALAYAEMCAVLVGFTCWYVRWYMSDEFVVRTATYAVKHDLDPVLVERTIDTHPRKADIRSEIERQLQ